MAVLKTFLALASILSIVFGDLLIRELSKDQELVSAKWVADLLERQEERFQRQENEIRLLRERVQQLELKLQQNVPIAKAKTIDGQPESCAEIGLASNGFYSIRKGEAIQNVFCDFSAPAGIEESPIGMVDIKSSPVFFYAQRFSDYTGDGNPMSFDFARLNIGDAMNVTTGVFTAPIGGVYLFSFSGLKGNTGVAVYLNLILNDYIVGSSFAGADTPFSTISLVSLLHLQTGDRVNLRLNTGGILDDNSAGPYTHFTGVLLQEDLSF